MPTVISYERMMVAPSLAAAVLLLMAVFVSPAYRSYLRVSYVKALLLALLALAATVVLLSLNARGVARIGRGLWGGADRPQRFIALISISLLAFLAVPFVVRLYRAWLRDDLTPAERLPNMAGVRAWLGPGNLICALGIALCAWLGLGYSFWGMLLLTLGAVLAYPLFNILSQKGDATMAHEMTTREDLSAERQRVLRLLEEGKITAEESSELLNALTESARVVAAPAGPALTSGRRLMLAGAVVLLLGFFLPWLTVDMAAETQRMAQQMTRVMPNLPGVPGGQMRIEAPRGFTAVTASSGLKVKVHGGDVGHGLGWIVLLLGVGAAVLPYVATTLPPHTQRTITLLALAAAGVILGYVLTGHLRHASLGLMVALAGVILEAVGAAQEYRLLATPAPRPAVA